MPSLSLPAALASILLVSACATTPRSGDEPPAKAAPCAPCPKGESSASLPANAKPLQAARWGDLPGWAEDDLLAAWPAFLNSCRALAGRAPSWPQWQAVCDDAMRLDASSNAVVRRFFESRFQPWLLTHPDGTTQGLITGYYEPLLHGSRSRGKPYLHAVLGAPADLLTIDLGSQLPDLKGLRLRGRLQGNKVVPYFSRAEILGREKDYADRVLLWVDDAVELFFLQVQGSGRVRLTDGSNTRLAYADQNGHPYQSVGRLLVERGELTPEQATMAGIKQWARTHPSRVAETLNANPSYVFFREQPLKNGDPEGPAGALGVPLVAERSIAVDTRYVPLGAPVYLSTRQPDSTLPWHRLVLAQDTGSAIRGVVRADLFWGFGNSAGLQAGRMRQQGQMWVLLPLTAAPR